VWKWNPGDTLSASSAILNRPSVLNVHCSAHSRLQDGRLLVTGGTETNGTSLGPNYVHVYDPATTQWSTLPHSMLYHRWYPTNTTLADGRILITSGRMFRELVAFGGRNGQDFKNDVSVLGLRGTSASLWVPSTVGGVLPAEREAHSAVFDETIRTLSAAGFRYLQRMLVFGGQDASGLALDDLWALTRDELSNWSWSQLNPQPDPVWDRPAGRSAHSAIVDSPDSSLVIFGGAGGNGVLLSDAWKLYMYRGPGRGGAGGPACNEQGEAAGWRRPAATFSRRRWLSYCTNVHPTRNFQSGDSSTTPSFVSMKNLPRLMYFSMPPTA
jgi:hypothetical protein